MDDCFTVNVHGAADEFSFNEMDQLERVALWDLTSDLNLDRLCPSEYLKRQQEAVLTNVEVNNGTADDETQL